VVIRGRLEIVYTTIRVRRRDKERLEALAREMGTSMSGVVAWLLDRYEVAVRMEEIAALLTAVHARLARLEERLRGIEGAVDDLRRRLRAVGARQPEVSPIEEVEVPEWLKGNPWLEVIGERGEQH